MKFPSEKKDKQFWLRLAGTLVTMGLLAWLLWQQGWGQITDAFQRIAWWRFAVALVFTLLSRVAVTLRWHILMRASERPVRFTQSLRLTFAGLFASNFLPTTVGGDVVRLAGAIQLGFDSAVTTASLVVDRLIGMAGMALALPWGFARMFSIGLPALLKPESTGSNSLVAITLPPVIIRLLEKSKVFIRRMFANISLWVRKPASLVLSLLFTLLHQLCLFLSIWFLLDGMGEPIPFMWVAGVWALVYFITLLPVSINGYGLQEISTTLLYTRLGGISPEASVTVALLVRTLQMLASLPGAFFVPGIVAARKRDI
ncbi:MAG: flippase-like domain-containing protein [Anaerolineaceae bacterium]|nr:flippase-like domain-containing protein [Anaerolineaceae bacterium]